jgi:unsaturated pyranuronate lyase
MKHWRWDDIEYEELSPGIARRVLHCEGLTAARIYLKKGAIVPLHRHVNEQLSYVLEGRLRFDFPDRRQEVAAGEMMQISANEPHAVEALEDSVALDVFQPVREDWLRGEDSYLRNPIPGSKRNKIET